MCLKTLIFTNCCLCSYINLCMVSTWWWSFRDQNILWNWLCLVLWHNICVKAYKDFGVLKEDHVTSNMMLTCWSPAELHVWPERPLVANPRPCWPLLSLCCRTAIGWGVAYRPKTSSKPSIFLKVKNARLHLSNFKGKEKEHKFSFCTIWDIRRTFYLLVYKQYYVFRKKRAYTWT